MRESLAADARRHAAVPARIAVLIPCYNEEFTVARVIRDFRAQLPEAEIVVFDNNSTDGTSAIAAAEGAVVVREAKQGKGYVVAAMLNKIDADIHVMVDGDCTYPADRVHDLIAPVAEGRADQVVGARRAVDPGKAYRPLHGLGNRVVTSLVNSVFGSHLGDVMSGYRAYTRELAQSVPVLSGGFDIETEFTLQCLEKGFVIVEVPVAYHERPEGSHSKLSTYRDGFRVIVRIVRILKDFRPFLFFGGLAVASALLCLLCGYLPVMDYIRERYVYHVPLAVLAGFLGTISIGLLQTGVVLATINTRFLELSALHRRAMMSRGSKGR
jgi:glycosyltransferase involved in cell wall biosynthesis